jgi:hypothetical protein
MASELRHEQDEIGGEVAGVGDGELGEVQKLWVAREA